MARTIVSTHAGKASAPYRFRIYNRWGELVYELTNAPVNDVTIGWDGMHRGIPVKPDVYVWMIEAQCESGDPLQLKGDISLLR